MYDGRSCSKYIVWLPYLFIMRVPYEGYSRNASCALNATSMLSLNATERMHVKKEEFRDTKVVMKVRK
jgi:hypothetical protein